MRNKILVLGLVCLLFMCCAKKFDEVQAKDVIKSAFELTEKDALEIIGISMESKDLALVKIKLNDVQVSSKIRKYDKGWQLDEIQNELGNWIPADTISRFFSQPEKQKDAMINITIISTALADFITDNGQAPNQDGTYDENGNFYLSLCPFYLRSLPIKDPWGNNYRVYCGKAGNGQYGISSCVSDDFVVVSYGKDGKKERWEFNASSPEAGIFVIESPDDFDKDLVMWNGSWIRAPRIF
jgi:hypothetical protein